jgi:hypothetical protein
MTADRWFAELTRKKDRNCQRGADMPIKIEEYDRNGKLVYSTYTDTWGHAIDIAVHRFKIEVEAKRP